MVKAGEDEDPLAVMTVLNTTVYKDKEFMTQVLKFLEAKCSDSKLQGRLREVGGHADEGHASPGASSRSAAPPTHNRVIAVVAWPDILTLTQAFQQASTGLLVSERLMNCPPQMAPPLVQLLFEEVAGAATDEESTDALREQFSFKRYL